jgi:cyclohexyl-isocyanide hydratase
LKVTGARRSHGFAPPFQFKEYLMKIDRRNLLQAATAAAIASPVHQASAETPMEKVLGKGSRGNEQIAMLLYPGFTALDLIGPYHFFSAMIGAKVHLVTTEPDLAPVQSDFGVALSPTVRMADITFPLDALFLPGGGRGTVAVAGRADVIDNVKRMAAASRYLTSVCTGSMVLAKAGLLRGKRATSHWLARSLLARHGARPVDQRVVVDGNVITAAGISAGLDLGIALVAALRGRAYAQAVMLQAEYDPQPPLPGGSFAKTPKEIGAFMRDLNAPLIAAFAEL